MKKKRQRESIALRLLKAACPPALLMKFRAAYLTREVLQGKALREHAMGALPALVQSGDSVADLGANIGMYALEFSQLVGARGKVYSVEPIEANFQILREVVRKRRLSNAQLFHAAIGAKAGQQEMIVPKAAGFIGFYSAHFVRNGETGDTETVQVFALDDLWKNNEIRALDFIKADVAGAELEVIAGARSLIAALRPGLLMGVSRRTGDNTLKTLREMGYRAFLYREQLVETSSYVAANSYHYFFLHPESKCWDRAVAGGLLAGVSEMDLA